jgi:hypothetical protein
MLSSLLLQLTSMIRKAKFAEPEERNWPRCFLWRRGAEQTRGQNCRLENLHDTHLLDILASQHHAFSISHSFKSLYSDVLVDSKYARVFRN